MYVHGHTWTQHERGQITQYKYTPHPGPVSQIAVCHCPVTMGPYHITDLGVGTTVSIVTAECMWARLPG